MNSKRYKKIAKFYRRQKRIMSRLHTLRREPETAGQVAKYLLELYYIQIKIHIILAQTERIYPAGGPVGIVEIRYNEQEVILGRHGTIYNR